MSTSILEPSAVEFDLSLDTLVEQVMSQRIVECSGDTPLHVAAHRMQEERVSCILVVDEHRVRGIWTEHDILELDLMQENVLDRPIEDFMSTPVKSIRRDAPLSNAALRMRAENIRHFLVVDDEGQRLGLLTQTDVILNQGVEFYLHLREVGSVMSRTTLILDAGTTLPQAMQQMRGLGVDAVVVTEEGNPDGILTERDIVRLIADGKAKERVGPHASRPLITVRAQTSIYQARSLFLEQRIRHLGVLDENDRVTGLLTFADILASVEHTYAQQLQETLRRREQALNQSKQTLQLAERIIDSSPNGIAILSEDARIVAANPALRHLSGYGSEALADMPLTAIIAAPDPQFIVQRLMGPFGRGRREETAILRQNGERVPVQLSISRIENQSGNEVRHAAIFNDLSAIKRSQASLAESEARLRAILEHVTEGIVVTDARGRILSANPAVERLLGRSASSIHERPLHEWITDVQGEDPWPQIEQTLSGGESWKGEVRWLRPGAEDLPLALGVQAIRGTDGRVLNHVAILSDISAHKAEQARLTRLALHDPLTGLPNRRLFEDRLMHALEGARRHRGRVGIVMVDLDDFKPINDRLGHDQGDIALRFIARRLRHQFRRVDTVARVGGDEFVVVLTDLAAPEDAVLVATKVLRAMQRPMRLKGERCSIGASIGISLYPHTAQDVMELIRQADQAMYLAKKEGGNRIRFWTRDMVDERKR